MAVTFQADYWRQTKLTTPECEQRIAFAQLGEDRWLIELNAYADSEFHVCVKLNDSWTFFYPQHIIDALAHFLPILSRN